MKIGVFDSGFGGLSILASCSKSMPAYDYVYLGDAARAPYGTRTPDEVLLYTKQAIDFLVSKQCSLIILACNTASALALRSIQQEYLPVQHPHVRVLGVLIPAAEAAVELTHNSRIGVMATPATVKSKSFIEEIEKLAPEMEVSQVACPDFVPLIEAAASEETIDSYAREYGAQLRRDAADTVILGCTHYELIAASIRPHVDGTLIGEGAVVAEKLGSYLERHDDIATQLQKSNQRSYYTTGDAEYFFQQAKRLIGVDCRAEHVRLE